VTRETWRRSAARALSWRLVASLMTALIAVVVAERSGAAKVDVLLSAALAAFGADFIVKLGLKLAHERAWAGVRWGLEQQPGFIVALFGLPCSGKTSIAERLERRLTSPARTVVRLDGDTLRGEDGLCRDLDFTREGRAENLRRTRCLAAAVADAGAAVVVANIMPHAADRAALQVAHERVMLVHVDTPADVCEARDVKGMWHSARAGEIADFTGVDGPFDVPKPHSVLTVKTVGVSPEACVAQILAELDDLEWL